MEKIKVVLVGYGYWGKNILRCLMAEPSIEVVCVCDKNSESITRVKEIYPSLTVSNDFDREITSERCDAVVIATPVKTHFAIAKLAITSNKHVLVEKPMCSSSAEAAKLNSLAEAHGVTLMVDHTYLFHPVVSQIKSLIDSGDLGEISYLDSRRINLGLFQPDVDVVWDLAPHDFSVAQYLLGGFPEHVHATGYCHVNEGLPDIAYVTTNFDNNTLAHFNLSWMSPTKKREMLIGGSKRMAVWNDLDNEQPLKVYDSGISYSAAHERENIMPSYRVGSIFSPKLKREEPLAQVMKHFSGVVSGKEKSIMDGKSGYECVKILEKISESIRINQLAEFSFCSSEPDDSLKMPVGKI